jgi:hypothetical protein
MLHMAWTASLAADNDYIWWSSFDGTTWSPPELLADRQSSTSPALAAVNDRLYMAWKGIGDDTLWWSSFDGTTWSPPETLVYGRSSVSPALGSS